MNPITSCTILEIEGFFSLTWSMIPGKEPMINPANKQTIENKQYSKANWNGKTRAATEMIEPIKNGNKISKFFQKDFVNKLSTASTMRLNAPKTSAMVPPEIPGTIIAVPIAIPVIPSLTGVGNFFFIDVYFSTL